MIGLSPLSTGHPLRFQPKWVRPSTESYLCFSLPMDRSPGFASTTYDYNAILKARFHYGSFQNLTSPHIVTRWLILQKARRHAARALRLLVGIRFQVLFHSPLGVLFTFPSRYWFAIGHKRVFSLREWSPWIHTGFHVSGITRVSSRRRPIHFAYRTITFSGRTFQTTSTMNGFCNCAWDIQAPTKTTPRHHMQQHPETYTCMGLG